MLIFTDQADKTSLIDLINFRFKLADNPLVDCCRDEQAPGHGLYVYV